MISVPSWPLQPVTMIFMRIPPLLILQFAVGHILEVLAVGALAIALCAFQQGVAVDPAVLECDLLGGADLDALTLLDHPHKVGCLHEAVHRAGIQPCKAAAQQLDVQLILLEVHIVQGRDLQLTAGRGLDLLCHLNDFLVVEVQAGDGVVALGMLGLFLDAQHLAVCVELHDAEALGVRHIVAEHGAAALVLGIGDSILQNLGEAVAVEDIVAQDHCAAVVADELFTEDESLSQAVRGRLDLILQMDAVLAKNSTPYFMYVKGVLQYEKKDYEGAIATFNQIIAEGKDFVAEAYSKIGDCSFFPAQEIVEENSKLSMDDPKYATNEAKIKELYEKALPFYEKAKEAKPDNRQLWGQYLLNIYWKLDKEKYNALEKELGY